MRKYLHLFLLGLAGLSAAYAQPTNTDQSTAIELPATRRSNIARQSIENASGGLWYKWMAPSYGEVTVTFFSGFVTFPQVFDVDGNLIADSDLAISYGGDEWTTDVSFSGVLGRTYFIRLEPSFGGSMSSSQFFSFTVAQGLGALPDNIASAGTLPTEVRLLEFEGTNTFATTQFNEPLHSDVSNRNSVWMKWTADRRATVKLDSFASPTPAVIGAYYPTIQGDLSFASLTKLASQDRRVAGWGITAYGESSFAAVPGVTYYFAIASRGTAGGPLKIKFSVTPRPPDFVTAPRIAYVQNATQGNIEVTVDGEGAIAYQWERLPAGQKTWVTLENNATYTGVTTANLQISNAAFNMAGDQFRVTATDENGTSTCPAIKLVVTQFEPFVTMVRQTASFDLKNGVALLPGQVYATSKLPAGLTLNPATGIISGTVSATAGNYAVTYWTQTGKTKGAVSTLLIVVEPFPSTLSGQFEALLEDSDSPFLPMGKLELAVTSTGAFTGRYTANDNKSHALRGMVALSGPSAAVATVALKTTPALTLSFAIQSNETLFANLSPTNAPLNTIAVTAAGVRVAKFAKGQTPAWAGKYTMALSNRTNLDPANPDRNAPTGSGYATGVINTDGTLSLRGRTADGTPLTALLTSTPTLAASDTFRLYANPYALSKAYVAGWLQLEQGTDSAYRILNAENVYWNVPSNTRLRGYTSGFGPIGLNVNMEPWTTTTSAASLRTVLNLGALPGSYTVTLNGAGLSDVERTFTVSSANRVTAATPLKLTINATTGLVTGSYTVAGSPARTAKLEGVLLPKEDPASSRAILQGFFALPHPSDKNPRFGDFTGAPTN